MVFPVSGFLPVPLPMMIPFMGAQSLVIGKMFGEGFQYGKRKISAMPNEEFNKLTFEKMMSNAREEIKASIPTMNGAMQDMQPMVEVVVREFFNYISLVTKLITGTGEGENIFQKEGHDIGDWIQAQLGIQHTPHDGSGQSIPVTPTIPQKTSINLDRSSTSRNIQHRHTPEHHIGVGTNVIQTRGKRLAGQSQRIARKQHIANIINLTRLVSQRTGARATNLKEQLRLQREKLTALEFRYRF